MEILVDMLCIILLGMSWPGIQYIAYGFILATIINKTLSIKYMCETVKTISER